MATVKLLEENIRRTLSDINHSKIFLDPPPRVMEIKTKINKSDRQGINLKIYKQLMQLNMKKQTT